EVRAIEELDRARGGVVVAVRERDQKLAPALLDLLFRKRRMAEDLEEQVGAFLHRARHELAAKAERVPTGESVDARRQRLDRAPEAVARVMAAPAGQESGDEVVDAVVLGPLEEEAAERHRAERDERRRVMLLHDQPDAVAEEA